MAETELLVLGEQTVLEDDLAGDGLAADASNTAYRGMTTAITLLSAAVVLVPNVDLFGIMMLAQVINGVLQAQGC